MGFEGIGYEVILSATVQLCLSWAVFNILGLDTKMYRYNKIRFTWEANRNTFLDFYLGIFFLLFDRTVNRVGNWGENG